MSTKTDLDSVEALANKLVDAWQPGPDDATERSAVRFAHDVRALCVELRDARATISEAWKATGVEGTVRWFGISLAEIISGRSKVMDDLKKENGALFTRLERVRAAIELGVDR